MMLPSAAEFGRRIRRTSQLRATCLRLKRAALEQWRLGRFPVRPLLDTRSDPAYWRDRAAEAAAKAAASEHNTDAPPPGGDAR